ncbi:hypothetical protein HPP92_010975 [Vanilla planifolia]|uniref:S-adenosylmethionine-dependent methyltransferase n=1 Tax=Vanilla planifolia TaxID=51239 RepID=A0A835QYV6_VANPL|nr:hypothetical protein HPP92_011336 [Vanilla planifolia]KAG0482891.1 hypothetical protein HPP92_010975 [Vanilla planifolia]
MASPQGCGVKVSVLLVASASAALLFLLLHSLSPSSTCPSSSGATVGYRWPEQIAATADDLSWLRSQIRLNSLPEPPNTHSAWHSLRKGINPRTRASQLEDLVSFKGISHYDGDLGDHTSLPCPAELLVEEHHSNYGEPWAGGRDVFEFLASAIALKSSDLVLEVGCGTLRVGLHFIRYLDSGHFHCFERDELSLLAALRYELPSQGLLNKRPLIRKGDDMNFSGFGKDNSFDLIYASAVFLHIPDQLVWVGLERLALKLKPEKGRIFVSHNIKFCSRIKEECSKRLEKIGLEYSGNHTHDSLLFNHYELWYEFRRRGNKSYL